MYTTAWRSLGVVITVGVFACGGDTSSGNQNTDGQNNNNQMVFYARTTTHADEKLFFMEHDGAGSITSLTLVAKVGEFHDVVFGGDGVHIAPTQGFSATKQYNSLNDNGDFIFCRQIIQS